jgi:hypothetical protein
MARIALTVYLMAAAIAGPWLMCCCMPLRAAELFAARTSTPPAEDRTPPCCKHHKPAPQAPKQTPSLPGVPCNCKDTQPMPFVPSAEEMVSHASFGKWLPVIDSALTSIQTAYADLHQSADLLSGGALAFPPGSGRELLATLHILRC